MKRIAAAALTLVVSTGAALAWGDDGHKVVALIAEHYLTPTAKRHVDALLATDTDPLTQHDIASEATWADKYRNKHRETASWHFVDLEITDPDFNRPAMAASAASRHAGLKRSAGLRSRQDQSVLRRAGRPQDRCGGTPDSVEVPAPLRWGHASTLAFIRP
jgi:hypothetical protein